MGYKKPTMHNLEVIEINNEDGLILIKGAVPGSKGTYLVIRDAIKPKSTMAKIKEEEIVEESSKKEKKADSGDDNKEKQQDKDAKGDKK